MKVKDLERTVNMICPTCGNDKFDSPEYDIENIWDAPDETKIQCSDCGLTLTKEELIGENQYVIDANIEDFKKEAIKKLEKELKKSFR